MGREIRHVPPDWQHPVNEAGRYQPLFNKTYWMAIKDQLLELGWYLKHPQSIREWFDFPDKAYYRPRFKDASAYQIYETVSEGTPVSPVFTNKADLKGWLLEQGYSDYAADQFIKSEWVPSMVFTPRAGLSMNIHSYDALREEDTDAHNP